MLLQPAVASSNTASPLRTSPMAASLASTQERSPDASAIPPPAPAAPPLPAAPPVAVVLLACAPPAPGPDEVVDPPSSTEPACPPGTASEPPQAMRHPTITEAQ